MGFLSTIAGRNSRSLENPKIPLSDPAITEYLGGGSETYSGARVDRGTSLGLSAFWRGVNLISNTVAKVPVDVYRRVKDDGREIDTNHPAQWVLRHQPNRDMTPMVFKQTMQAHVLLHGNAYAYIARVGSGDVDELIPLKPESTWIDVIADNGDYVYVSRTDRGVEYRIAPENILHIKGLSHDGIMGYSVIDTLREVLGFGVALQRYGNVFFRNNAAPKVVVHLKGRLKDQAAVERFRESWGRVHGGLDNSHKPAILEDEAAVTALNINNEQIQFLDSKKFSLIDLANIFGLPPHKLGDSTRTSYNSLEQENQAYLDDAIDPWFVKWEHECNAKLLRYSERLRDNRYVEFKRQALMRVDFAARVEGYNKLWQMAAINAEEICKKENLPLPPDGTGKKYFYPLNLGIVGEPRPDQQPAVEAPKEEKPEKEPERSLPALPVDDILHIQREAIRHEAERYHRRITEGLQRASKKPQSFVGWLDVEMEKHHREAMVKDLRPHVKTCVLITRGSTGAETTLFVDRWFADWRNQMLDLSGRVTADELENAVTLFVQERSPEMFVSYVMDELKGGRDAA